MVRNYFKIAWRNLWKQKGVTAIQITGLSVALAICLLIVLLLQYEYGFDRYHAKADRIYRIVKEYRGDSEKEYSVTTPYPLPAAFRTDFPELAAVAAINVEEDAVIKTPSANLFKVPLVVFAEPQLADMLDIEMKTGEAKAALTNPNQVILSENVSRKYFGDSNPVGQVIKLNNKKDLQVAGVMKDWPAKSHLQPSMLVSYVTFDSTYLDFDIDQWGMNMTGRTYFMTPPNFDVVAFEPKLTAFVKKHFPDDQVDKLTLKAQPLTTFHLDNQYKSESETPGISKRYLDVFLLIACLILLLALINYVNLSTARGMLRNKEIGVRKAMGAARLQVAGQLLAESTVLTLLAGFIALGIVAAIIPFFNQVFDKSLSFAISPLFAAIYIVSLLIISLLAGFYPSFIISGQKPLLLAKVKSFGAGKNRQWVRQSLVAVQFACAIAFLFGTLVIALQVHYIRHKNPGYRTDNMLTISLPEPKHLDVLRREWSQLAGIDHLSFGIGAPVSDNSFGTSLSPDKANKNIRIDIEAKLADAEYLATYDLQLLNGRLLTLEDEKFADTKLPKEQQRYHFLINEKLVKALGFKDAADAIGKKYAIGINSIEGEVVGVVKDFHYQSLHEEIRPLLLMNFPYFYYSAGLHITAANPQPVIAALQASYKKYFPDALFEYEFMDETLNKYYKADQQAFSILLFFSILALVLACLGLVGLSVFVIQRRVKEIGIRKVLGASVRGVVQLLSWEFLKPVFFACLLAFPLAWWAMNKWLENFAYRISIPWWLLVATGSIAVLIALLTVGVQSLKAAVANPVKALRTE